MYKMLATTLLVGALAVTTATTPAGAQWLADTGIFSGDTGSSGSDTSDATNDTGAETDTGSGGDITTGEDTGIGEDTGDTGVESSDGTQETYSAAELANDKGGCSTVSGSPGPWTLSLLGLVVGYRRRRSA